jgi:hypothetical protein
LLHVSPGLSFFAALFFVMLAPWDWDNTKLMLWCYVLLLAPIGALLARQRLAVRAGLVALLVYPGVIAVGAASSPARAAAIVDLERRAAVCRALQGLRPDDRVATEQTFNHPVALCGHALVAGYAGHLWSHGILSKPVEERLGRLMRGEPGWEADAQVLEARYLFWGPGEERAWPGSRRPWAAAAPVAEGAWGRLYRLAP